MKKLFILILTGFLPFCGEAQLTKLMSKYHEKSGIAVTQLDKSLYGLYQRENLSAETKTMLQKLNEVNILNVDLASCELNVGNQVITQFKSILDNPEKYKLVKSRNDGYSKQLIYSQSKNGTISNLVVWNQTPNHIDIIELQGDIQLEKMALLSKALNLKGLNSLATLSSNPDFNSPRPRRVFLESDQLFSQMLQMTDTMQKHFGKASITGFRKNTTSDNEDSFDSFGSMSFFGGLSNSFQGFDDFEGFEELTPEEMEKLFKNGGRTKKHFQAFGDGGNTGSSSVEITEINGKTKMKINSQNSDIIYVIDGQEAPKDNVQMPEKILNINLIPSKKDVKKAYLFVTSQDPVGQFTSFKNRTLIFKYNNQEYKYNLDKIQEYVFVIDGRLSNNFNIVPSRILQIRPISQVEKEVGYYPNAEVIINTK